MKNIVLASGSPRRRELLSQIGIDYTVEVSDIDEKEIYRNKTDAAEIVAELAYAKADAVRKSRMSEGKKDEIIIGADTIVCFKGRILGKPRDEKDAYDMLNMLSGEVHQVYTGVAILISGTETAAEQRFYEKTDVEICRMSDDEIREYIKTGDPMDKAGSYGIQGIFAKYVKSILGDYYNVVGMPVSRLYHELRGFIRYDNISQLC